MKLSDMLFANAMMGEGGGGGGDFTIAHVTVTFGLGGYYIYTARLSTVDDDTFIDCMIVDDGEYSIVIPTNGSTTAYVIGNDTVTATVTGDVLFIEEEQVFIITGDGTITINSIT